MNQLKAIITYAVVIGIIGVGVYILLNSKPIPIQPYYGNKNPPQITPTEIVPQLQEDKSPWKE